MTVRNSTRNTSPNPRCRIRGSLPGKAESRRVPSIEEALARVRPKPKESPTPALFAVELSQPLLKVLTACAPGSTRTRKVKFQLGFNRFTEIWEQLSIRIQAVVREFRTGKVGKRLKGAAKALREQVSQYVEVVEKHTVCTRDATALCATLERILRSINELHQKALALAA